MGEKGYVRSLFVEHDALQDEILEDLIKEGMPAISVQSDVGKLLYLLVKMTGRKRILEIGTLGGYSTLWLARGLLPDGHVISLELKEEFANFAREKIQKAGLENQVTIRVGDALEQLDYLIQEQATFDFFFLDADKLQYSTYLDKALELATPGAIITADNLFQSGAILDKENQNPSTVAVREFNEKIARHPRLESLLLTMGDGLGICLVKE